MISKLPRDLAEEVLSKLRVTSLRGVRSTCKKWNKLSKNRSFVMKHIAKAKAAAKNYHRKEFQVVMMIQYRVCLFSVNLLNPSIDRIGKLISLDDADRVDISKVFHCDGLLLCITKDRSSLVVWNPCSGQTRWIKPRNSYHILLDRYALGYEWKNKYSLRSYKVLRFLDNYDSSVNVKRLLREFEIYDLDSDSWKVVDVNPDWDIQYHQRGVSLMGNTYWFSQEKPPPLVPGEVGGDISDIPDFLLCFDFTTERFGPRLPLPFHAFYGDTVTLSSVREKHLAVLFQQCGAYTVKIWISSKIEPNAVSWKKLFLAVDMKPLTGFQFLVIGGSFFVDEKKKVAVILDKDRGKRHPTRNIAYIIGKKGYYKQVDLGESIDAGCWPLVCSYVPSSVQIKQAAPP
ncbi:F-box associated domain type 1 [Arabidopsis suecica]|uniref:F-box associated domain type 1 n=1 Tax=Arabidopsis suecica TaxID=45249 RepID=A0A8T2BEK7_ARASU|nr:F-box associated domain type 1 [Arabidopsis suecica]